MPPDHNLDDYVDPLRARPPARRPAAGRPRRAGRLGQDRAGRGAVPHAGRRVRPRRRHQRHLHDRGRRLPAPQRRPPRRPDRGGADRLLPAHRDPRRHHRQPRRRRAARARHPGLELVLVESGGDNLTATLQLRPGRRADLRHRRRRRGQGAAQGRAGRDRRRPARRQQDRPRADGRRRPRRHAPRLGRRAERQADAPHLAARGPVGRDRGGVGAGAGAGPGAVAPREDAGRDRRPGRSGRPDGAAGRPGERAVRRPADRAVDGAPGRDGVRSARRGRRGGVRGRRGGRAADACGRWRRRSRCPRAGDRGPRCSGSPPTVAGTLDLRLEPTVVAARAHHLAELAVELDRRRRPHRDRAGAARPRRRGAGPLDRDDADRAGRPSAAAHHRRARARASPPGCHRWPHGPMHLRCTSATRRGRSRPGRTPSGCRCPAAG